MTEKEKFSEMFYNTKNLISDITENTKEKEAHRDWKKNIGIGLPNDARKERKPM